MSADLGVLCDALQRKDEEIDKLKEKLKALDAEYDELATKLTDALDAAGTKAAKGSKGKVEFETKLRVSFSDFDKFAAWLARSKAFHIFERRIGINAYKELVATLPKGKGIPGLKEFEQRLLKLSVVK